MADTGNRKIVERFIHQVWDRGDPEALDELVADGFTDHTAAPGLPPGIEGLEGFIEALHRAFPALSVTVDEVLEDGQTVVAHWTARGTHEISFMGIPASGTELEAQGLSLFRLEGGRIAEKRTYWNTLALLEETGAAMPVSAVS